MQGEGGARFRFIAYVETDNGDKFVELFGGRRSKEKMRYIRPDRVLKMPKRRKRRKVS